MMDERVGLAGDGHQRALKCSVVRTDSKKIPAGDGSRPPVIVRPIDELEFPLRGEKAGMGNRLRPVRERIGRSPGRRSPARDTTPPPCRLSMADN